MYKSAQPTKTTVKLEAPDVRKARNLPMPGPGIMVRVPLHLWPAYMELYGLELIKGQPRPPLEKPVVVLVRTAALRRASLVKRTEKNKEVS
jgi:hypothetical protein